MRITYYTEIISSWCYWAEPTWAELCARYSGVAEFSWKISLMDASGLPKSRSQCDWFYRRSGTMVNSPFMLHSGWVDAKLSEYLAPNLVAEAAKDFGVVDDRVRLAIARAALRDGARVGEWETSSRIAVEAAPGLLDLEKLLELAGSPEIEARVRADTQEFYALGMTQRPGFFLENAYGDRATFSGLASLAPLVATMDALLADERAITAYNVDHGTPPPE